MQNIQNLTIDINKKPFQTITANTGEVASRFVRINIVDKSIPVDLTGVTVSLYAKKPDGKKVFNSVTVEDKTNGIILAELTSQILAVEGLVKLTLLLVKNGGKLCSKQFLLNVDSSIVDDDAIESTNEFTALVDALGRVNNIDSRLDSVDSQLEHNANEINNKRDKNVKINNSDLDTSSDETKIKLINLSNEVKSAMAGTTPIAPTPSKFSINRENVNTLNTDVLEEKKVVNNNLFNKYDIMIGYLINVNGEVYENNQSSFVSNYIPIKPNTVYSTNMNRATFYDLEGNFIFQTDDRTFTTTLDSSYIRLSGGVDYIDNYTLSKGDVAEIVPYRYMLEGLGSSEQTLKMFNEIDKEVSILDTIKDVDINYIESSNTIKVTLLGTQGYNNTFYVYKNNKLTNTVKTIQLNEEFELQVWQSLILDLKNNNIRIIDENLEENSSSYIVLLTRSIYKSGLNGFLSEKYSLRKSLDISSAYNDMIKTTNLYIKNEDAQCAIKFDSILINRGSFYKEYSYEKVIEDLGSYLYLNSEWVKQCIKLPNNFVLVFNTKEEKFKLATLGNFTSLYDIMLAFNNNGVLQGLLAECKSSNDISLYNSRNKNIDNKYLNKIQEKENIILEELNDTDFIFGYSTDTHSENSNTTLPNLVKLVMNRVCETINVDAILNGGDSVAYGKPNKNESIEDLKNVVNGFYDKSKILHAIGNHDFNGVSGFDGYDGKERKSWLITKKEVYRILQSHLANDNSVHFGSKEDLYFYKDFEDKKIRVIVMNTSDLEEIWEDDGEGEYLKYTHLNIGGVRQNQLEWLANTALNFSHKQNKEDWHTMVLCHIGLYSQDEGLTWNYPKVENKNVVRDIIANFISGSKNTLIYTDTQYEGMFNSNINVDFTSQGPMAFIGVFSGHNHLDRIIKDGKLNQITTTCGYPDSSLVNVEPANTRSILDYTEFAFDIIKVDKNARNVKLYRFGAGEDREFFY